MKDMPRYFFWILKCCVYFLYISHTLNNSIIGFYIFCFLLINMSRLYCTKKTYITSFPSMASVIPDQRLSHHLLPQCINLVHSFTPTSNISLNLQFGSFLFNFSHNPSDHIHLINNTSSHKKKRIRAPSDRRREM